MRDFQRGNSINMTALNYNSNLDDFIRNIVSKGFSIDRVAPRFIPKSIKVTKAKKKFLSRESDISYIFDTEAEDGSLISQSPSPTEPAFRQQIVDTVQSDKVDALFEEGLNKIKK